MQGSFASCSTRTRLVWTTCCSNCAISMGIGPWTMLPWRETCITVAKTLCEMAGRACALRVFLFVLPAAASQGTRSVSGVNCLATATRSVSGVNCLATARAPVKRLIGKRTKRSANRRRSRRMAQMLQALMLPMTLVQPMGAQGRPPHWPRTTRHLSPPQEEHKSGLN